MDDAQTFNKKQQTGHEQAKVVSMENNHANNLNEVTTPQKVEQLPKRFHTIYESDTCKSTCGLFCFVSYVCR